MGRSREGIREEGGEREGRRKDGYKRNKEGEVRGNERDEGGRETAIKRKVVSRKG